ncbi:MAG: hypothetical protein JWP64_4352 [Pseudonocardia sp.]|uniref:hypothetical protein n=1 Tax=Pseudonocardia sp. TaxID=60912 RepID=UPI002635F8FC|nr:hypothetical protein [Pseudonocardia sp.]MCU1629403.1 hypothetical protein [Pseudonocardia sp.]
MLYGLLHHRPLRRGNRRVALIATTQFLALNGWQLDIEPPQDLARVLLAADSPAVLATWMRQRLHRAGAGLLPLTETEPFPIAHLGELQRAEDAAIDAGDFRQAAILRAQERELPAPDPGGETARLRQEVDRLRALLQDAGIDPEAGTPRTA